MAGNNMESLLMGDSSSGESDDEEAVPVSAATAAPVAAPAPAPPPAAPPAANDQMARLKSLYQQQRAAAPPPNPPAPTRPAIPQRPATVAPQPVQQQQMSQQQPQQSQPPPQQHYQAPAPRPAPQQQQFNPAQQRQTSGTTPSGVPDPFAPTPLDRIKERHQQTMQQQQQQQIQQIPPQQQYHRPPSQIPPMQQQQQPPQQPPAAPMQQQQQRAPQDQAAMERELRRQKEKFLMFTRVLIKYLEQKDPRLHQQAKMIIKDCADRNKRKERGYESVTAAMKERLKELVGEQYWKRAEAYLKHFLEQKKAAATGGVPPGAPGGPRPAVPPVGGAQPLPSSSATTAAGARTPQAQTAQQQQQQQQDKQRKLQMAKQAKPTKPQPTPQTSTAPPTIQQVQREIATQKAKVVAKGKGAPVAKKQVKRKPSITAPTNRPKTATVTASPAATVPTVSTPASSSAPVPLDPEALPPREYNELMKLVDHAMDFDWTTAGLLLGSKMDLQLTEEQHNLLYAELTGSNRKPEDTAATTNSSSPATTGPRPGWGNQNVVSSRAAWALVRLREQKQQRSSTPAVGDVGLTLPQTPGTPTETTNTPATKLDASSDTAWYNEEKAEQDVALAMLSEGTEIYLKGVLEKAIQCARQRQNLDGIRLWHQQYTTATNKGDTNHDNDTDNSKKKTESNRPALSLRLGCDLERQQAQAAGNAAMTVKRMEQALGRQSGVPARARMLQGETLNEATSMADLALRPQLAKGAEAADQHAKRRFEIYGGKDATEPPLGRVPKQAKLELIDFVMGSHLIGPVGRHRASNAATSIYF